jgi:hypothetical protein
VIPYGSNCNYTVHRPFTVSRILQNQSSMNMSLMELLLYSHSHVCGSLGLMATVMAMAPCPTPNSDQRLEAGTFRPSLQRGDSQCSA